MIRKNNFIILVILAAFTEVIFIFVNIIRADVIDRVSTIEDIIFSCFDLNFPSIFWLGFLCIGWFMVTMLSSFIAKKIGGKQFTATLYVFSYSLVVAIFSIGQFLLYVLLRGEQISDSMWLAIFFLAISAFIILISTLKLSKLVETNSTEILR